MAIAALLCNSLGEARTLCRVSYAPQRSYTTLDLSAQRIATHDTWYMNGDGGSSSSSIGAFIAQNGSTTRAIFEQYVDSGGGKDIVGGLNTTNLIILDIEGAVPLKMLGLWLADERANATTTFQDVIAAYKLRVSVARSVFPQAEIALYGSPAQPASFAGENWTLAAEGYVAAAAHGIFDEVHYLLAVQYFGVNVTQSTHENNVFGTVNRTMALARLLKRSTGEAIPIIANTKPTYRGGPLVPPFAGWLEAATVRALVARWAEEPLVKRVVWWYYPLDDLEKYHQPSLASQGKWWSTVDAWSACPLTTPRSALSAATSTASTLSAALPRRGRLGTTIAALALLQPVGVRRCHGLLPESPSDVDTRLIVANL